MRPTGSVASTLSRNLRPMLNIKCVKWAQKDFSHTNNRALEVKEPLGRPVSPTREIGPEGVQPSLLPMPAARVGRQPVALRAFDTTGQGNYGKLPPPNQSTDAHPIWLSGLSLSFDDQNGRPLKHPLPKDSFLAYGDRR